MKFSLATLWRRAANPRRREVALREVKLPSMLATDLYLDAYKPIVQAWETALPRIAAAYERSLSELTTDSPEEIGGIVSEVENELTRVLLTVRLRLERWARRVEAIQRQRWRGAVLSATSVDIETLVGANDVRTTLAAAIEANVGLVRSVSDQTRDRIQAEVFQGLRERKPAREVAVAIREKVGMGRRRALNIASDQLVKIGAELNDERRREAGIYTWEWLSSHKVHFRPEHAARDHKRYSDGDAPKDLPGRLPFCGCTSRAVLSLDDEF